MKKFETEGTELPDVDVTGSENYPEFSSERSICRILFGLEKLKDGEKQREEEVKKEFEILKNSLRREGQENLIRNKSFLSTLEHLKNKKYESALPSFKVFLKEYQPFDTKKLLDLVKAAKKASLEIQGKKVILPLGASGVGKSTFTHWICGTIMEETIVSMKSGRNIPHIQPTKIKNKALENVKPSPYLRSETKNITPVLLEEGVVFCDTPGFIADTEGVEKNVANIIAIIETIKNAQSIVPLILFNVKEKGSRFSTVKDTIKVISKMLPEVENHKDAFSYVLTKCNGKEKSEFLGLIEDFVEHLTLEEKEDKVFELFLRDLCNADKGEHPKLSLIEEHLLEKTQPFRKEFLEKLINGPSISPSAFSSAITDESKKIIQLQLSKHKLRIEFALKNENYVLVNYKLNEFKELSEVLNDAEIKKDYEECHKLVLENLKNLLQETRNNLIKNITKGTRLLKKEDLKTYKKNMESLKIFQVFPELKDKLIISKDSKSSLVEEQAEHYFSMLKKIEYNISDARFKDCLDNLLMLTSEFDEVKPIYEKAKKALLGKLNATFDFAKDAIAKFDFDKIEIHIKEIRRVCESFSELGSDHLGKETEKEILSKLGNEIVTQLHEKNNNEINFLLSLEAESWGKSDTQKIHAYYLALAECKKITFLKNPIHQKPIDDIQKSFVEKINQKNEKFIQSLASGEDVNWLKHEKCLSHLSLFMEITGIEKHKNRFIENINEALKKVHEKVETQIESLKGDKNSTNYQTLNKYLSTLVNVPWRIRQDNLAYNDIWTSINKKLQLHLAQLEIYVANLSCDLNYLNVREIKEIDEAITELRKNSAISLKNLEKTFENKKLEICEAIKKAFDFESQNIKKREVEFDKYIKINEEYNACDPLPFLSLHNFKGLSDLEEEIKSLKDSLKIEVENTKEGILWAESKEKELTTISVAYDKLQNGEYNKKNPLEKLASGVDDFLNFKFTYEVLKPAKKFLADQGYKTIEDVKKALKTITASKITVIKAGELKEKEINEKIGSLSNISAECKSKKLKQTQLLKQGDFFTIGDLNSTITELFFDIKYRKATSYVPLFKAFDPKQIDALFEYAALCSQNISALIVSVLENYLKSYVLFIEKDINYSFDAIYNQTGQEQNEILLLRIKALSAHIKTISNLFVNHKNIFSYFQKNIIEKSRAMFEEQALLLSEQMKNATIVDLKTKLKVAKQLVILDEYIKGECKYSSIYKKYEEVFQQSLTEKHKETIQKIKQYDFSNIEKSLLELKKADIKIYDDVRLIFLLTVESLLEDANKNIDVIESFLDDSFSKEKQQLLEELGAIKKGAPFISDCLDEKEKKRFNLDIKNIDERISEIFSKETLKIEKLLSSYSLKEARSLIESLKKEMEVFKSHYGYDSKGLINRLKHSLNVVLNSMIKEYTSVGIEKYDIYKPSKLINTLSSLGLDTLQFKDFYLTNFNIHLSQLKEKHNITEAERGLDHLYSLMDENMPEDIKKPIFSEIEIQKSEIENKKRMWQNTLAQLVKEDGQASLVKQTMFDNHFFNDITINSIIEKLNDYGSNISDILNKPTERKVVDKEKMELAFNDEFFPKLKELLEYSTHFKEYKNITFSYERTLLRIKEKIEKMSFLVNEFVTKIKDSSHNDSPEIKIYFVVLVNLYKAVKKTADIKHPLLTPIETSISAIFSVLNAEELNYFKKCDDGLKENTVETVRQLKKDLIHFEKLDCFVEQYKALGFDKSEKLKLSSEIKKNILSGFILSQNEFENLELINKDTSLNIPKRLLACYEELKTKIEILVEKQALETFFEAEDLKYFKDKNKAYYFNMLAKKVFALSSEAQKIIEPTEDGDFSDQDLRTLNYSYNNLIALQEIFSPFFNEELANIGKIKNAIIEKVDASLLMIETNKDNTTMLAEHLLKITKISQNIVYLEEEINKKRNEKTEAVGKNNELIMDSVGEILKNSESGLGGIIIKEISSVFKDESIFHFNNDSKKVDIDEVLKKLTVKSTSSNEVIPTDKKTLKNAHSTSLDNYSKQLQKYLDKGKGASLEGLIEEIKLAVQNIVSDQENETFLWSAIIRGKIPHLMGLLFALWALKNSDRYFEKKDSKDAYTYLNKPHPGQIVAICLLLGIGIDDKNKHLTNALLEIPTGEGKSVIFAVFAMICALLGYDYKNACFSKHLSTRDYEEFKELFEMLGIVKKEEEKKKEEIKTEEIKDVKKEEDTKEEIKEVKKEGNKKRKDVITYGPFNELCENIIFNKFGDVRTRIENTILVKKEKIQFEENKQETIVAVDESDTMLKEDFCAGSYIPATPIMDPLITTLAHHIWKESKNIGFYYDKNTFNSIEGSSEYKNCLPLFEKDAAPIFEEAVKAMIEDLVDIGNHKYVVCKEDKKDEEDKKNEEFVIGYPMHDSISTKSTLRYSTMWAYFKEHYEAKDSKITLETLEKNIAIRLNSGEFSYTEIAGAKVIVGLTATLNTLNKAERKNLKNNFKISHFGIISSIFGKPSLKFNPETNVFIIEKKNAWYAKIEGGIDESIAKGLPVIVFFRNQKELYEFNNYYLSVQKDAPDINILTEELGLKQRESCIKKATLPGKITFATESYARGTNFKCLDEKINDAGGPTVIGTFLPESPSARKQFMGRTARHGKPGSVLMYLFGPDLKEILDHSGTTIEKILKEKNWYVRLQEIGDKYFEDTSSVQPEKMEITKVQHEKTMTFAKALLQSCDSNYQSRIAFIKEQNLSSLFKKVSKTVILLDTTGSMGTHITSTKHAITATCEAICGTLKDFGYSKNSYLIKIIAYKQYDDGRGNPEKEFITESAWTSDPEVIKTFLNGTPARGGSDPGEEAVECAIFTLKEEKDLSQVLVFADAGGNTKEQILHHKNKSGAEHWAKSKYKDVKDFKEELKEFKELNKTSKIPFFAYPLSNDKTLKNDFEYLAKETGGECKLLDPNSVTAVKELGLEVGSRIVKDVGGEKKGDEMQEKFKQKFSWNSK
jgi:energy-coupling factor transporter ATP-binding protein EcfA2